MFDIDLGGPMSILYAGYGFMTFSYFFTRPINYHTGTYFEIATDRPTVGPYGGLMYELELV